MPEGHPQPAAEKVLEKAEDRVLFTIFQRQQCVLFFRHSYFWVNMILMSRSLHLYSQQLLWKLPTKQQGIYLGCHLSAREMGHVMLGHDGMPMSV